MHEILDLFDPLSVVRIIDQYYHLAVFFLHGYPEIPFQIPEIETPDQFRGDDDSVFVEDEGDTIVSFKRPG